MNLFGKAIIFLCLLVVFALSGARSDSALGLTRADTAEKRYKVFLRYRRHTQNYRKFLYYTQEMSRIKTQYSQDRTKFRKCAGYSYLSGSCSSSYIPDLDEVLRDASTKLVVKLDQLTTKALRLVLDFVPGYPVTRRALGEGLRLIEDYSALDVKFDEKAMDTLEGVAFSEGSAQGALFDHINDQSRRWLGAKTTDDLSSRQEIETYNMIADNADGIEDLEAFIADKVGEVIRRQKEELELRNRLLGEQTSEQARRQSEEAYQKKKAEILGGLQLFGYASQLLGRPDLGRVAFGAADGFSKVAHLVENHEKLGVLALTSGYVGVAMGVMDIFSSDGSGDAQEKYFDAILDQLGEIHRQMHERFDQIDEKLNLIWLDMLDQFANIDHRLDAIEQILETEFRQMSAQLSSVRASVAAIESRVGRIEQTMLEIHRDETEVDLEAMRQNLILNSHLSAESFVEDLIKLQVLATLGASKLPFISNSSIDTLEHQGVIDMFSDLSTGGQPSLSDLGFGLGVLYRKWFERKFGRPPDRSNSNERLVNPSAWAYAAKAYSDVLSARWFALAPGSVTSGSAPPEVTRNVLDELDRFEQRATALFNRDGVPEADDVLAWLLEKYKKSVKGLFSELEAHLNAYSAEEVKGVNFFAKPQDIFRRVKDKKLFPVSLGDTIRACARHASIPEEIGSPADRLFLRDEKWRLFVAFGVVPQPSACFFARWGPARHSFRFITRSGDAVIQRSYIDIENPDQTRENYNKLRQLEIDWNGHGSSGEGGMERYKNEAVVDRLHPVETRILGQDLSQHLWHQLCIETKFPPPPGSALLQRCSSDRDRDTNEFMAPYYEAFDLPFRVKRAPNWRGGELMKEGLRLFTKEMTNQKDKFYQRLLSSLSTGDLRLAALKVERFRSLITGFISLGYNKTLRGNESVHSILFGENSLVGQRRVEYIIVDAKKRKLGLAHVKKVINKSTERFEQTLPKFKRFEMPGNLIEIRNNLKDMYIHQLGLS